MGMFISRDYLSASGPTSRKRVRSRLSSTRVKEFPILGENLNTAGCEIRIICDELPVIVPADLLEQSIIEVDPARIKVIQDAINVDYPERMVCPRGELQNRSCIRGHSISNSSEVRRLPETFEIWVLRLIEGAPFNATIGIEVFTENERVQYEADACVQHTA